MPKQEWEEKLLVDDRTFQLKVDKFTIEYRLMPWMMEEDLQAEYLMQVDAKTKKMKNDLSSYALAVLKWGVMKGPWDDGMKDAAIIKLKPSIKDDLVKLITNKENKTELKKK